MTKRTTPTVPHRGSDSSHGTTRSSKVVAGCFFFTNRIRDRRIDTDTGGRFAPIPPVDAGTELALKASRASPPVSVDCRRARRESSRVCAPEAAGLQTALCDHQAPCSGPQPPPARAARSCPAPGSATRPRQNGDAEEDEGGALRETGRTISFNVAAPCPPAAREGTPFSTPPRPRPAVITGCAA